MPRLGWTMEVGRVVEWLKQDGETVEAGEFLFSVESDKSVTEVEALDSGVLRLPPDAPPVGEEVPVGGLLAYIVLPGEMAPFERSASAAVSAVPAATVAANANAVSATPVAVLAPHRPVGRDGRSTISPRARRTAAQHGLDWAVLAGSGSS